jgi:hypothetical protein
VLGIRSTTCIGTLYIVNTRQRGVEFGIFIDDMIEVLGVLFELRIEHTDPLFDQRRILVTTITTIINDVVTVIFVNLNVVHVVTAGAKLHGI